MPATDTPQTDPLAPCGYCRRCAVHDDPGGCLTVERYVRSRQYAEQGGYACPRCAKWLNSPEEAADHQDWHRRKDDGDRTKRLLDSLPLGTEITLGDAGRAYTGTYRRNAEGLWDQVWAREAPLVTNFDPAHLGFCVGYEPIRKAVAACPTL